MAFMPSLVYMCGVLSTAAGLSVMPSFVCLCVVFSTAGVHAVPTSTLGVCAVSSTGSVSVLRSTLCIFMVLNAVCAFFVPFRYRLAGQAQHSFSIQSLFRKSSFSALVVLHSISEMPATNHSLPHAQARAEIASVQEVLQLVLCHLIFLLYIIPDMLDRLALAPSDRIIACGITATSFFVLPL